VRPATWGQGKVEANRLRQAAEGDPQAIAEGVHGLDAVGQRESTLTPKPELGHFPPG
jgi:hypothetical protein